MEHEQRKTSRREFLKGSVEGLIATPVAIVAVGSPSEEEALPEEREERFPGDPGYRDPGLYGSLAD